MVTLPYSWRIAGGFREGTLWGIPVRSFGEIQKSILEEILQMLL